MLFRLALHLGFAHPDHLLASLTSRQLTEWMAYYHIEPFGEERADFRAGQVCATVANFAGKSLKDDAEAARPDDFMPALKRPTEPAAELPPEEHAALVKRVIFGVT